MSKKNNTTDAKHAKKKARLNVISIILIVVLSGVMIFAGYQIYNILSEYAKGDSEYNDLVEIVGGDDLLSSGELEFEGSGMQNLPFDELKAINDDTIGWIINPGTIINYPVVQTDNNDTYLHTTFDGTANANGCIFLDYNNSPLFTDTNSIIYGHHMKSGKMFASLCEYQNQDYYEEHPVMYLYTPEQIYKLEVFSAYIDEPTGIYTTIGFANENDILGFYRKLQSKSLIETDVELTADDRIITMQTCTYEFENARFIVHCKLVPVD